MNRRYAVIGGGISGLVAAYRLREADPGADIVLFDPADRLGGVLRTETFAGQPLDIGAEAFVARRPEVPALLAELGLADRLIRPTGVRPAIYSQDRLHPLPAGALNGIPATAESVAGLVDHATAEVIRSEPRRPMSWQTGADPAVGDLVGDRFGQQVVARSVDPMLSGVYAGSAAGIGLRSAVPTVAAALDAGAGSLSDAVRLAQPPAGTTGPVFGAVDGGYRVLLEALVAAGRSRWEQAAITHLERDGSGWSLRDVAGRSWPADAVIVATPAGQAAVLIAGVAPEAAAAVGRVATASSVVLALAMPGGTPFPPQSGVLVATGEPLHAKAITLSTRKWGSRGPYELVRLSFGRYGDDLAATATDTELVGWALADVEAVFGIAAEPEAVLIHRWLDALPQYGPGHGGLSAAMRAALPAGLALAGNYLDGVGVPACLSAAGRAAARVCPPG